MCCNYVLLYLKLVECTLLLVINLQGCKSQTIDNSCASFQYKNNVTGYVITGDRGIVYYQQYKELFAKVPIYRIQQPNKQGKIWRLLFNVVHDFTRKLSKDKLNWTLYKKARSCSFVHSKVHSTWSSIKYDLIRFEPFKFPRVCMR